MLSLEDVSQFMYENLQLTSVGNDGKSFNSRCPFCGDSKKNLKKKRFHLKYLNENSVIFNCFNCNCRGTFYDLYAFIMGISRSESYKVFNKMNIKNLRDKLIPKKKEVVRDNFVEDAIEDKEFSLILNDCLSLKSKPEGFIQTKLFNILKNFYEKRYISEDIDIYISFRGYWKNRIIIPIYDNKKLIYFQGRAISNDIDPKYKNPEAEKKNVILNKNNFEKNKYIVVTEGILDALSMGNQGTVCLGASISDNFISKIFDLTDKGVIISLDNDITGKTNMLKIIENSEFNNKLKFFIMPNRYKNIKDLNEFQVKYGKTLDVYNFVIENIYNKLEAKVRLRI